MFSLNIFNTLNPKQFTTRGKSYVFSITVRIATRDRHERSRQSASNWPPRQHVPSLHWQRQILDVSTAKPRITFVLFFYSVGTAQTRAARIDSSAVYSFVVMLLYFKILINSTCSLYHVYYPSHRTIGLHFIAFPPGQWNSTRPRVDI